MTASAIAPLEARMAAFMLRHPGTTGEGTPARRRAANGPGGMRNATAAMSTDETRFRQKVANHGLKLPSPGRRRDVRLVGIAITRTGERLFPPTAC